jgi:hypothetical protein
VSITTKAALMTFAGSLGATALAIVTDIHPLIWQGGLSAAAISCVSTIVVANMLDAERRVNDLLKQFDRAAGRCQCPPE